MSIEQLLIVARANRTPEQQHLIDVKMKARRVVLEAKLNKMMKELEVTEELLNKRCVI